MVEVNHSERENVTARRNGRTWQCWNINCCKNHSTAPKTRLNTLKIWRRTRLQPLSKLRRGESRFREKAEIHRHLFTCRLLPKILSVWPRNISRAGTPRAQQATFPWESTQNTTRDQGTFAGRVGEEGKGRRQRLQTPAKNQTFHLEPQASGKTLKSQWRETTMEMGKEKEIQTKTVKATGSVFWKCKEKKQGITERFG